MITNLDHIWWDDGFIYKWTSAELTAQVIATKQARSDLEERLDSQLECGAVEANATKLFRN